MSEPEQSLIDVDGIDKCVFKQAEVLVEAWGNGVGKRLYKLADGDENLPPVFAWATYNREVNPNTGNLIDVVTVEDIGYIHPNVSFSSDASRVTDKLIDDNPELWDEFTVEMMVGEAETFIELRIRELLKDASPNDFLDIHLHKEIRLPVDSIEEAEKLHEYSNGSFSVDEWEAFLWAMSEETTYLDRIYDPEEGVNVNDAYAIIPQFESVSEWRLQAIENHLCGVFMNTPSLANVAAIMDEGAFSTQVEMAKELFKSETTISEQVSDVREWNARAKWTAKKELLKNEHYRPEDEDALNWAHLRESVDLAMQSEDIDAETRNTVLTTVDDAIGNNWESLVSWDDF